MKRPARIEHSIEVEEEEAQALSSPSHLGATEDVSSGNGAPLAPFPFSVNTILAVEFAERLAFYGVMSVMMPFMRDVQLSLPLSNGVANLYAFYAFGACLVGGYFGDAVSGLVRTVGVSCGIMAVGCMALCAVSATQTYATEGGSTLTDAQSIGYVMALFLIGSAAGGIKANVVPLLALQLEKDDGEDDDVPPSVFRWVYWAINLGALLGSLLCPLLHLPFGGVAYQLSLALPALGALFAFSTFYRYQHRFADRAPSSSLISNSMRAIWANTFGGEVNTALLDDVWQTVRACKVFVFFPIYWCAQKQHHTAYIPQGDMLDRPPWLPSELMSALNPFTLIIGIPFFESHIFPLLVSRGYGGNMTRIGVGLAIQTLAIALCTALQWWIDSKGEYTEGGFVLREGEERLSIYYQVPSYVLTGVGEIFASVGGLEFAYRVAPVKMKSLVMSLYLLMGALGNLLGVLYSPFMYAQNMTNVFGAMTLMVAFATFIFVVMNRKDIGHELSQGK